MSVNRTDMDKIFRSYSAKIYGLALSLLKNSYDAEDCVQNTFGKIAAKIGSFKGRSALSTWIYRIAYNEALMIYRARKRERISISPAEDLGSSVLPFYVDWSKTPSRLLYLKEIGDVIDNAIDCMPIKYRIPVILHAIDDFTVNDTAYILSLKPQTVKTRLHRGYLQLRSAFSSYLNDSPQPSCRRVNEECRKWVGFILDYVNDDLPDAVKSGFTNHIKDCPGCKSFLTSYRDALRITRNLTCSDIPASLEKKIRDFLK